MRKEWKEKITSNIFTYENKHGKVIIEAITPFGPVKTFKRLPEHDQYMIDMDTCENIVAITDNRRMSISPTWPLSNKFYILKYSSSNTCAMCKLNELVWRAKITGKEVIETATRIESYATNPMYRIPPV